MVILTTLLAVLLTGSLVYCALTVIAAKRYLAVKIPAISANVPPVSLLKPLCGHDEGLEENLRSFFSQDYPQFEILFAVHRADDPAAQVVEKLMNEYSGKIEAKLLVTGESPIPNAKAFNLQRLVREASHELLVMCDSDVRVKPDFLHQLAQEFSDPQVGLVTCPYRGVPGESIWSRLEATGMNTEFLGGVLVARMIEGMKFALGPALALRKTVLEAMGGFAYLQDYLAEDFIMGQRAAQLGYAVLLSSEVVEHRIGSQNMMKNLGHRLRWARSTRRSRPAGYWGQIFTYPLPWALLLFAVHSSAWPLLVATVMLRAIAAWVTASEVLHDSLIRRQWWLLPIQDLLGFFVWMSGFLGDTIVWRDRECTVLRDGRLQVNP
ncbi:MAG TPA: bacteriohopanetetrol glucosamine biosynthesis glycosyltransferase HpnI [Candidatus Angelobacter sp.]|nr:bacteriohopanetetrol glucosamine biosynthesis glycosyltransferase HpnI [Candidatus Angelobacter sp.]